MWSSLNYKRFATRRSFMTVALLSISLTLLIPTWSYSVSNKISWIQEYKDSNSTSIAKATATDKHGNALVGGLETPNGAFLGKYNADGTLLWKRSLGSKFWFIKDIAVAENDYIYVVGVMILPKGREDIFVRKYGPNGGIIWTRHFGSHDMVFAGGIAVYKNYIYVVGSTYGALPKKTAKGGSDAFIRKYNTDARLYWTRQFGTSGDDGAEGIAVDSRGYIYVVGGIEGDAGSEAFIRKYGSQGKHRWTRQSSNTANNSLAIGLSVSVDSRLNVYTVGIDLMSVKGFVQKYSPGGKRRWRRTWSSGWTSASAVDNRDNLYVFIGSSAWPSVAFVRKYSRAGRRRWTKKITECMVNDAAVSVDNSLYVVGDIYDEGGGDWFLAKY